MTEHPPAPPDEDISPAPSSPSWPQGPSPPSAVPSYPPPWWVHPPRRSRMRRVALIAGGFVLVISVILNVELLALMFAGSGQAMRKSVLRDGSDEQVVAVYKVDGVLDWEAAGRFERFAREVSRDGNVKAVVIRVVSPGGSMSSSDEIHRHVVRLKKADKKVIVSMGAVAASGGYYISAPADEIIAEPTSVTGSIGVIAGWLVVKGTLDKIGVEAVVMKSAHARGWKDEISSFQKPDQRQRDHIQEVLDKMQERFEQIVRAARGGKLKTRRRSYTITVGEGDDASEVQHSETEPFNGKIYLADEAKQLGLIDDVGYQDNAVERAAALAELTDPKVIHYSQRKGLLAALIRSNAPQNVKLAAETLEALQTPRIMAIWRAQ